MNNTNWMKIENKKHITQDGEIINLKHYYRQDIKLESNELYLYGYVNISLKYHGIRLRAKDMDYSKPLDKEYTKAGLIAANFSSPIRDANQIIEAIINKKGYGYNSTMTSFWEEDNLFHFYFEWDNETPENQATLSYNSTIKLAQAYFNCMKDFGEDVAKEWTKEYWWPLFLEQLEKLNKIQVD